MRVTHEILFTVSISRREYLRYYRGLAKDVIVRSRDGRRIQFPARYLRPFVDHSGVHGEFRLTVDDRRKLIDLQRV